MKNEEIYFDQWMDYIENLVGLILPASQQNWLSNAVTQTAAHYNLSVNDLWTAVHNDQKIRQYLIDMSMIPQTRFFRHQMSFLFVSDYLKDWYENKSNSHKKFKVMSVGCSTGQEVWSLAMQLYATDIKNFQITGVDVSSSSIQTAKQAVYDTKDLFNIPNVYHKYINNISEKKWQMNASLQRHVKLLVHNVFMDTTILEPNQDVIMCQNMLMYFRQFDQRDILNKLAALCVLDGYIILSPGEAGFWSHPKMEKVTDRKVNAWKKVQR